MACDGDDCAVHGFPIWQQGVIYDKWGKYVCSKIDDYEAFCLVILVDQESVSKKSYIEGEYRWIRTCR